MPMPMVNMISGAARGREPGIPGLSGVAGRCYELSRGIRVDGGIYRRLGKLLQRSGFEGHLVGDEGGYGPRLKSLEQAAEFVIAAIEDEGWSRGNKWLWGWMWHRRIFSPLESIVCTRRESGH